MEVLWVALSLTLLLFMGLVKDKTGSLEKMIVSIGLGQVAFPVFAAFFRLGTENVNLVPNVDETNKKGQEGGYADR
jgi:hypothetical protein